MAVSTEGGARSPMREEEPVPRPSQSSEADIEASEVTPLISRPQDDAHDSTNTRRSSAASLLRSIQGENKPRRRWPSLVALVLLCVVAVLIMILGFFAPQAMEQYAMQAATFEPTSLSIQVFTSYGLKARIQGDFKLDSSRVKGGSIRGFGKLGTWVAAKVESGWSSVDVSIPEFGNVVIGHAEIPPIVVDIRDGHTTHLDFISDVTPGDREVMKKIARDWVDGRLGQLRILGKAQVPISSGIFSLGKQSVSHALVFDNSDIPKIPKYDIHKIKFHDIDMPGTDMAIAADASVSVENKYPVDVQVPPLGFEVLVPNCSPDQARIPIAYVSTESLHVLPKTDVDIDLLGVVSELPPAFTQQCPDERDSPMDTLVGNYINGKDAQVFVRGSSTPVDNIPRWITDMISDITVPISVPGHTFGHLIRNFSLADVHFGLPDPMAEEGSPEANPTISAIIKAIVALPDQMNFNLSVNHVRADADVYYKGSKLGKLDLQKWQDANSTEVATTDPEAKPSLLVQSRVEKAPLIITDDDVFTDVVQALLFGGSRVVLGIKADVDVQIETAIGQLTVRKVPAEGRVPVKPIGDRAGIGKVKPEIGQLQILDTSKTSLTISALMNFTNPTDYSASIPFADVQILSNGSVLGHGTVQTVHLKPGKNTNIPVTAVWDPMTSGGKHAHAVGVELLSQYISGFNTTITVRTHEGSLPTLPGLGRALSKFAIDIPTPHLLAPPKDGDDDDGGPDDPEDPSDPDGGKKRKGVHFISDATMHLLSSSATFTLQSPLRTSTLYITYINATALYKDEQVGHIDYDEPFAVPPAVPVMTPSLPVDWSLGSVGYDAIKNAVGGSLKLAARATVGVKLGRWEERIWFIGKGIGARIRL